MNKVCEYFNRCYVKVFGRNCADFETCQTYKFWQKYGTEELFVGSVFRIPSGLLEGKLEVETLTKSQEDKNGKETQNDGRPSGSCND